MRPYAKQTNILHIEAVSFTSICVSWNLCVSQQQLPLWNSKPFFPHTLRRQWLRRQWLRRQQQILVGILDSLKKKKKSGLFPWKNTENLFAIQAKRKLKNCLVLHDPLKENWREKQKKMNGFGYDFIWKYGNDSNRSVSNWSWISFGLGIV